MDKVQNIFKFLQSSLLLKWQLVWPTVEDSLIVEAISGGASHSEWVHIYNYVIPCLKQFCAFRCSISILSMFVPNEFVVPEAAMTLKRLADLIAETTKEIYRQVMGWMWCKLSFKLLQSSLLCIERHGPADHRMFNNCGGKSWKAALSLKKCLQKPARYRLIETDIQLCHTKS